MVKNQFDMGTWKLRKRHRENIQTIPKHLRCFSKKNKAGENVKNKAVFQRGWHYNLGTSVTITRIALNVVSLQKKKKKDNADRRIN